MKNMEFVYEPEINIPKEDKEIASYRKFIHEIEVMVGNYRSDLKHTTERTSEHENGIVEVIERIEGFAEKFGLELDY